jgi:chromosome segregation protein
VRLREEMELFRRELEEMERDIIGRRESVSEGIGERERRRRLVQAATESIAGLHEETNVWVDRVKEIEDLRNNVREQLHESETELATMDVRRSNLVERIEEQHKGRFRELIRSLDHEMLPQELEFDQDVFNEDQARTLLGQARHKLSGLGAVNHLAVEEYETKRERLNFLEAQLADVEKARDDLTSTIHKINITARKLFQETFEEVRRNYIAVFQTLFEGGRADLLLEATDDPLEAGIRILAQPKGKRVDHIRLLSGGERCLTALSLLFAVYLVKPSPFCLLDEADAPLDDANVDRFVRMLREFSGNTQFLVVTHNKLTMETANHLYGVTMMEEGVSNLVSVSFKDVAESQDDAALANAIAKRRREVDDHVAEEAVVADDEAVSAAADHEMRFDMADVQVEDETPAEDTASDDDAVVSEDTTPSEPVSAYAAAAGGEQDITVTDDHVDDEITED